MSVEQVVGVIGAIFAGLVLLISAVGTLLISLRTQQKIEEDSEDKAKRLQEIHVLVNSRLDSALKEISGLRAQVAILTGRPEDAQRAQAAERAADRGVK